MYKLLGVNDKSRSVETTIVNETTVIFISVYDDDIEFTIAAHKLDEEDKPLFDIALPITSDILMKVNDNSSIRISATEIKIAL